ncbi:hypothetical protein HYPSUDRAFT_205354 [Hypholoma sublateritium FD-334 SS-4]|uniref:F-box domain-containing protein n=1 Tax=Hypholoma sublateritium (strain FD-334 SS-4) TaxID=945553 RepID=A0A0D2NP13_HYPSF|nr:hypothetical protein HYPSUDRAFT_205354 [Hypholoma sublateritium FD-334 SS-4]
MPDTRPSSYIHILNDDVLLRILEINGDMFTEKNALADTVRASQVCHTWRSTMLGTPTLWARLIDFDALYDLNKNKWARELIRRSEESPLWLKAEHEEHWNHTFNNPHVHQSQIFFLSILDKHWKRIQKIDLNSEVLRHIDVLSGPIYRPAPLLDMFCIQSSSDISERGSKMHRFVELFSGSAPVLRTFFASFLRFDCNVAWLHNLHSLQLGAVQLGGVFDICDIFTVLSATHNLEHLKVSSSNKIVPHVSRPVCLRNLKDLTLHLSFEEMAFTLDNLTIPTGCTLNLNTFPRDAPEGWEDKFESKLLTVMHSLSRASRRYFQSCPVKILSIKCTEEAMQMFNAICDGDMNDSQFSILCIYFLPCPKNAADMYSAFYFPEFASIEELRLEYAVLTPSARDLAFIQHFSSVTSLYAYEQLFDHLTAVQLHLSKSTRRKTILFPQLQRITIRPMHTFHKARIPTRTVGNDIVMFILARIEDGHPISVIDLRLCGSLPSRLPFHGPAASEQRALLRPEVDTCTPVFQLYPFSLPCVYERSLNHTLFLRTSLPHRFGLRPGVRVRSPRCSARAAPG